MIWDRLQAAWNSLLDLIGQLVSPDWGWVISLLPMLLVLLVLLGLVYLRWVRVANSVWNASRLPRRRAAPPPPSGLHLPGPSLWPFLLPLGGALMLGGLIFKPGRSAPPTLDPTTGAPIVGAPAGPAELVNLPFLIAGLVIALIGIVGWYRDANRELRKVELHDAGLEPEAPAAPSEAGALPAAAEPVAALEPPPGVHVPGPSPWPFFAPVGMAFALFGLIISPALVLGGILMCAIAVIGWYRDASREYGYVDAGQPPEPRTRDPERAFPKALAGIFVLIAFVSLAVAVTPALLSAATAQPSPSPGASGGGGGTATTVTITANGLKFEPQQVTVAAGQALTIHFDNQDSVQHDIAIFAGADANAPLVFRGQVFAGPKAVDYSVPALTAGSYFFHCDVHPTMTGTITAK
ncbi:MAG: cupredoxin domain-containing protein [Candidatus Limnocylindrales bacterium]